ncbi:hypothetical protein G7054_g10844 [Neopestalotiopsis clavispora]|nr:hypothetical protein G7054_g10844 [Neopestalotiopsis clavispora]
MSSTSAQEDKTTVAPAAAAADEELGPPAKFSPEEEAACKQMKTMELLSESNDKKTEANKLFSSASYDNAISKYEEAASVCPHYLDYELAVLQSNISACHLKLEQWKEAVTSASKALDGLEKIEKADAAAAAAAATDPRVKEEDGDVEEEIVSTGAQKSAPAQGQESDAEVAARKRKEDILRIRAKALMRRARAKSELDGWANLSGAEEDYKALSVMDNLSPADRKIVASQLRSLPPRTKAAQEKEMAEMWGKLKDLGNGILKPFGLSTDNFNMVKDEKTGGYSMNFNQK